MSIDFIFAMYCFFSWHRLKVMREYLCTCSVPLHFVRVNSLTIMTHFCVPLIGKTVQNLQFIFTPREIYLLPGHNGREIYSSTTVTVAVCGVTHVLRDSIVVRGLCSTFKLPHLCAQQTVVSESISLKPPAGS